MLEPESSWQRQAQSSAEKEVRPSLSCYLDRDCIDLCHATHKATLPELRAIMQLRSSRDQPASCVPPPAQQHHPPPTGSPTHSYRETCVCVSCTASVLLLLLLLLLLLCARLRGQSKRYSPHCSHSSPALSLCTPRLAPVLAPLAALTRMCTSAAACWLAACCCSWPHSAARPAGC